MLVPRPRLALHSQPSGPPHPLKQLKTAQHLSSCCYYVCVHIGAHMHAGGSEKKSVGGVSSLPVPCGFQAARLGSKHLYPLNCLIGPQLLNLKHEGPETWTGAGA